MRLLICSAFRRIQGGAESYLENIIPALAGRGHQIAFCAEREGDSNRPLIALPPPASQWCIAELGAQQALQRARHFAPELVFCHRLDDLGFERALQALGPSVFFAHNYYGTCISGSKTRSFPRPTPCPRIFGPGCLLQYFPRRCGGLNPVTMLQLYGQAGDRLALLKQYTTVLTNSRYLSEEYRRHGIQATDVPLFALVDSESGESLPSDHYSLLFAGRMEKLKGGALLLDALPLLHERLHRDLHVTFAGDGRERQAWAIQAQKLPAGIQVSFTGWLSRPELAEHYAGSHLLVIPSLWPEPFGLVGLEAGLQGTPAVAFPVGGIPEWLQHGENGVLAALPPSAEGLASAMAQALHPDLYPQLRAKAAAAARAFSLERHCRHLERELMRALAVHSSPSAASLATADKQSVSMSAASPEGR